MTQYRKKPVVVEAMQWRGPQIGAIDYSVAFDDWMIANQGNRKCKYVGDKVVIPTFEGNKTANPGDWIVCCVKGELYPCHPRLFAAIYEPVETQGETAGT